MKLTKLQKEVELAMLDGWVMEPHGKSMIKEFPDRLREAGVGSPQLGYYLTSYDAIIPLIQKQEKKTLLRMITFLHVPHVDLFTVIIAAPPELFAEALLKSMGFEI